MRLLHQFYAWLFGYFWMPCPACGRYFGGHEVKPGHFTTKMVDGHNKVCCPKCQTGVNEIVFPNGSKFIFRKTSLDGPDYIFQHLKPINNWIKNRNYKQK